MVDALKIEAVDRVFPDTFNVHATTDKSRWQDLYDFQTTTTAQIADLQGKVLDNTQQLAIQNNVSFTVSNTLGGSISVITQTTDTLFTTIIINGTQVYSSQGIEVGLSLTKSYEVTNADTVVVNNAVDASFIPFADSGNSYATTSYVDSAIASVHIDGALIFQGTVPTVADLNSITNPETGDYYQALDNGQFYLFNGTEFVEATGLTDLSDYYTKSEVDTKISASIGGGITQSDLGVALTGYLPLNGPNSPITQVNTPTQFNKTLSITGTGQIYQTSVSVIKSSMSFDGSSHLGLTYTPTGDTDAIPKRYVDDNFTTLTSFADHTSTDGTRWQDQYTISKEMYDGFAATKGLKPNSSMPHNIAMYSSVDNQYTVTDDYGGLITLTTSNYQGWDTEVYINNTLRYSNAGIAMGVKLTKYIPVNKNDTFYFSTDGDTTVTASYVAYIPDPNSYMQGIFNQLDTQANQIANLSQQILNIKASIQNQIPDTANTVSIANSTYTVTSTLGGQLVGKGTVVLGLLGIKVASTGTVTVNGTNVYDNTSLLGVGTVETLTTDVYDGDVIVSDGMASLTFTPYIAV